MRAKYCSRELIPWRRGRVRFRQVIEQYLASDRSVEKELPQTTHESVKEVFRLGMAKSTVE